MAEDTPTAAAPAAEPERAPADSKAGPEGSTPEVPKEKEAEATNGSDKKPSGKSSAINPFSSPLDGQPRQGVTRWRG